MDAPTVRTWKRLLIDVVLVLFLVGLGVKAAYGGAAARDADGGDECSYLIASTLIAERGLPAVEGAPLYVLWYALLTRTGLPLEDMPFLSWAVLGTLLPVSVYLLVRSIGGGRLVALAAAGFLPASTLIDIWPYPMHLATVILLLGAALAARLGRAAPAAAVLGLSLLLATYCRPEFVYSLYLFSAVAAGGAAWLLWRRPESRRSVLVSLVLLASGSALVVWGLGSPKGKGDRAIAAFGQHYALNRNNAGARTENPWHHWELYVRDDFGDSKTLGEAWEANPRAFLWHVGTNVRTVPSVLRAAAAPHIDLTLLGYPHVTPQRSPPRHPQTEAITRWALLTVLAVGLFGAAVGLRRQLLGRDEGRGLVVLVFVLGLVAAPALASSLVIYPRFHYLLPTIVFGIGLAAGGLRHFPVPERWAAMRVPRPAAVALATALLATLTLTVPNRASGWCLQTKLGKKRGVKMVRDKPTPIRASVETVRRLGLRAPVLFMDHSGAPRSFYAGYGPTYVHPTHMTPGEGFLDFVRRTNAGLVVIEPLAVACPQLRGDPDFRALAEGRESELFRLVRVEKYPEISFAVRRDLSPN